MSSWRDPGEARPPPDSPQERQRVVGAGVAVEAEEQHALPLAEAQAARLERDLLGARPEQREQHALPVGGRAREEPLEQRLDVAEEPGFALADTDERARNSCGHICD